ncbi:MAG: glycosyl hydrolase family 18 protein, partial [Oscillospiraceae bacterium]|nr:glycosyl hydrolase family 18 protein [Oscillospiraceae bacterium]
MNSKRSTHLRRLCSILTMLCLAVTMLSGTVFAASVQQTASEKPAYRNVMYYGDWSIWGGQKNYYPKDIPADQLTHLNFAFLDFDASGNLVFTDKDAATGAPVGMGVTWGAPNAGILNAMQELRAQNPNLKIGVSIGGWSKSGDFSVVAASASTRAAFVENVMKFLRYTNMDFVDLDWEYPGEYRDPDLVDNKNDEGTTHAGPADKQNYILLLKDLRAALDKQGAELGKTYELSVALPAPKTKLDNGIDIPELFKIVDFANMMTYDMRGAWDEYSGHQTPLYTNPDDPYADAGYSVDDTVKYLLSQGAPADKIVIGCAFYTRGWQKVDGGVDGTGLFGKAEKVNKDADQTESYGATNEAPLKDGEGGRAGGVWSYNALDQLKGAFGGLQEYWDDVAKAPYMYSKTTGAFFTYDNARSIREKVAYVKANGLGGCISWMASQDKATSGTKRDELTKVLKESLFGSAPLPAQEIVTTPIDITFTVEPYEEEWTRSAGYAITIKNNETKNESNEVLSLIELAAESIKNPKLYITLKNGATLSSGGYGCGTITNQNGVAIVDLATVYDNQTIAQGVSISIQLRSSTAEVSLEDIESIVLVQRILPTGAEISRQVVFGGAPQNAAPVLSGVKNQSIRVGASFDPMAGVTALDKEDGDLTDKITVSGSVDTSKAGSYTLTYSVTDSQGKETAAKAVITVEENAAPVLSGVKDQSVTLGASFDPMAGVTALDKEDG